MSSGYSILGAGSIFSLWYLIFLVKWLAITYGRGVFKCLKTANIDKFDWYGLALDRDSWKNVLNGL